MNFTDSIRNSILVIIEAGIILGSLGVVSLSNIIYSAFLLGFVFICIAFLYLTLNADFLSAAQILIYVGAVNVLIVFAVMLINNPKEIKTKEPWNISNNISIFLCTSLFVSLSFTILKTNWSNLYSIQHSLNILDQMPSNIRLIGKNLLTKFLIPFELLSILLLVALIGAITIARRDEFIEADDSESLDSKEESVEKKNKKKIEYSLSKIL
uniref:NAD(P)H-quinone oxidoreductase subunit 6 n=1 Tax=Equisetum xylochaetum TaxID=2461340 RepID=UPI00218228D2|nr:NAD(P)H-quinone oxidoreductase subunit 6 [Equisetum xylochaetum]UVF28190.1 NAD(P)H-quinone oxidoreductase subunit 6 [Equisetum xylochaetum]